MQDSSSGQRLLLHKIKGMRLSGWDRVALRRGCPHCPSAGPDAGLTFHIVWHCPAAQALWGEVARFWRRLGMWPHNPATAPDGLQRAAFSVQLPATPGGAWVSVPRTTPLHAQVTEIHDILQRVWQGHVLCCFQVIWSWRQCVGDTEAPWSLAIASAALRGRFAAKLQSLIVGLPRDASRIGGPRLLLAACRRHLDVASSSPPSNQPAATATHLLFFDGGSRGNPGPGGAGAVIIRVETEGSNPELLWSAAMSLASTRTTNNQAEYFGLLTGLSAVYRHRWLPLEVIGDSALIINQLRGYRPPTNAVLLRLYGKARWLADQLNVAHWHHHLRAYNKMADAAANIAMDGCRSLQTHHPSSCLHQLITGDISQWQTSTHTGLASPG